MTSTPDEYDDTTVDGPDPEDALGAHGNPDTDTDHQPAPPNVLDAVEPDEDVDPVDPDEEGTS